MKVKDTIKKLEELRGKGSSLTQSDKAEIEKLHIEVLDRKMAHTSCSNCYSDAVTMLLLYIRKHGGFKEKTAYRLKNGVLLQMEFGSSKFYTNDNLTDKVAEEYLAKFPENSKLFSVLPEDWEVKVEMRKSTSGDNPDPEENTSSGAETTPKK
jgi:hypothetical protein